MQQALPHEDIAGGPDFTVVIPTCNRPHMLRRALASALCQTYESFDIVVVDDASDRPVVVDDMSERRVTLLRSQRRLGAGGARNLGVTHARGNWIAFLDDDDEFEANFLRCTSARLQLSPHSRFSWCSLVLVNYDGHEYPVRESALPYPEDYESEDKLLATAVSIGSSFGFTVSREAFQRLGGFDESYPVMGDTEFFFRLIAAGHRPVVVSQPLVRFHNHPEPRLTDQRSLSSRIQACERIRSRYTDIIGQYPGLGEHLSRALRGLTRGKLPRPT
jgi:glycosyltransferase involved in cell wall biosynthesis